MIGDALVEQACVVLHDAYERAAVEAGWETNPASRTTWSGVPEANKATMRAAISALLEWSASQPFCPAYIAGYESTMRQFAEEVELRETLPDGVLVWMESQTYSDLQRKYKPE